MDSLVVMRRPLNKPIGQKASFIKPVPVKARKGVRPKSPLRETTSCEADGSRHNISFVKLYNELCLCDGDARPKSANARMKVDAATEFPPDMLWSESADSVVRAYLSHIGRKWGAGNVTAEVVLEIGYGNQRYRRKTKRVRLRRFDIN